MLTNVKQIQATKYAFAAIRDDGNSESQNEGAWDEAPVDFSRACGVCVLFVLFVSFGLKGAPKVIEFQLKLNYGVGTWFVWFDKGVLKVESAYG